MQRRAPRIQGEMGFLEHSPAEDLSPYVDRVWASAQPGESAGESKVLPDGCVEIVVAVEGRFGLIRRAHHRQASFPTITVLGLSTHPLDTIFLGGTHLVGVRLTPAGAVALLGDGVAGLVNRSADLASMFPVLARSIEEGAGEFAPPESVGRLERVLRSALGDRKCASPRIEQALSLLHFASGSLSISEAARRVGVSARQLDRYFERYLGIAPKQLGRIGRFRRALQLGAHGRRGEWASIAARCGYADQAHLSREFLELSGEAPERLRCQWATCANPSA